MCAVAVSANRAAVVKAERQMDSLRRVVPAFQTGANACDAEII
jgi:hypothetical protein